MKIRLKAQSDGSVMVATLLTSMIVGIGVASFLMMVSNQNYSTMRSLAWNAATPLAEAGIEEALTHLNDDSSLTANNWSSQLINGQTVYQKRRDFVGDGSYYRVTISNANSPVIFSEASAPGPLGRRNVSRNIRVTTVPNGLYRPAIFVKQGIDLGNDFLLDSFDSTSPDSSTNGKYDAAKVKANGNLASISTAAGAVNIQDSKIFGHMYTPPSGGYRLGNNGMVGDQAFQSASANAGTVQPGYYSGDLNTTIPDATPPAGWQSFSYPPGGLINGLSYKCILASGSYQLPPGTTLTGNVLVVGDATLYVPQDGSIQFGSGDGITISSSLGATLKLYNASSTDAVLSNLSNDSGTATQFTYYGLPTTAGTKATFAGGATAFAGTIYAPNQDIVLTGPASGNQDFIGAITANSVTVSGHNSMHFDEALAKSGGSPRIVIDSYAEVASSAGF